MMHTMVTCFDFNTKGPARGQNDAPKVTNIVRAFMLADFNCNCKQRTKRLALGLQDATNDPIGRMADPCQTGRGQPIGFAVTLLLSTVTEHVKREHASRFGLR